MTSFPTTGPVSASIDVQWGDIRVVAGEDGATVVDVTPTDPSNEKDRLAADDTAVSCADGRLRVVGPKNRTGVFNKRYGSVQVSVQLATESALDAETGLGSVVAHGRLGVCRIRSSAGDVQVQDAASADLRTGMGVVVARDIAGEALCKTGSGAVQIDRIGGRAEVRNANGDTRIGVSTGPLRVKSANGAITIGRALGDVTATTALGNLSIGIAEGGAVQLKTSMGRIDVGIPSGTAALLDLTTSFGVVRNGLDAAAQPPVGARTVEIHAQTSAGDIEVVRVPGDDPGGSEVPR
jgi:DUF4097 and DUF4098 domain-containing protein YvlB